MKIKRIDLFLPRYSQYEALHHFTRQIEQAFQAYGIQTQLFSLNTGGARTMNVQPVQDLLQDPPDFMFSFNANAPVRKEGEPNMVKTPYLTLLVDSAHYFMPLLDYPTIMTGFVDRSGVDLFQERKSNRALFIPHGVESTLQPDPFLPKRYEIVFLATLTDYESIRSSWAGRFSKEQCKVMDRALQLAFQNPSIPYYALFMQAMEELRADPEKILFREGISGVEVYLRGKERIDLLRSITKVNVDLFGNGIVENCKKYLSDRLNIIPHSMVTYEEGLQIMKQSKMVLHLCSWIKYGAHERIFSALACGALPIAEPNPYLESFFKHEESILYFSPQFQDINELLQKYLLQSDQRNAIIEKGRQIVMQSHTWEVRAKQILEETAALIATMHL